MAQNYPSRRDLIWVDDGEELHPLQRGKRGFFRVIFSRAFFIALFLLVEFVLVFLAAHYLGEYSYTFYIFSRILAVVIILYLMNESGNPDQKITWIVLILVVPALGISLYLITRTDIGHRVVNRRLTETIRMTEPYFPDQSAVMERLKTADPALYGLANYTLRTVHCPVYDNTIAEYYPGGEEKFAALLKAIESAEHFIFLEYFILDDGVMWGRILKLLEEKVRAGVEVRVIYDGMCAFTRLPYSYPKQLEALGIRCKMFSPLRPFVSTFYNNRDHRKIAVIDGRIAFTGGVNLADEYINLKPKFGHWKDASISFVGPAVRSFTLMFLQMWDLDEPEPDDFSKYLAYEHTHTAAGYVLPYFDSPLDRELVGETVYLDILNRAERYVHIMTPYLILDHETITALTTAAKRGVDVELILPHIPDKKYAFALAKGHYRELLDAGVKIFEYTPGFLHAKVFVSDDKKAVVGTINLDYRSLYLHFECAAYLSECPAVADVERDFLATRAQSMEIEPKNWGFSYPMRVSAILLKMFAPLM